MATYAQFKHVELYKIGHGKNRVPNAPKSSIGEIFNHDVVDHASPKNGMNRSRTPRDTPTRPRDTHSRLFGQVSANSPAPMVTDNIRSNIQFGEGQTNGIATPIQSPKSMTNGSFSSTPSREGNPITGDGYKSMNGEIKAVTNFYSNQSVNHKRVPPGGRASGLW